MTPCDATMAEYLRLGIEVGVLEPAVARAWADAIVEALPRPPGEVIDVAWSRSLPELLTNLRLIPGERDSKLAGLWLLGSLRDDLPSDDEPLDRAVRQALQVCRAAGLDDDICRRFDVVDDLLSLARTGAYGSIADCRGEFVDALAEYPAPPAALRFPKIGR